jgi:hypothetical protein
MNLRCTYCQTPFTLGMDEKIAALRKMHAEDLHHYDAHCPRCGRANPVSRERLEMFTPGWETAIASAPQAGAEETPAPEPEPAPVMASEPAPTPMQEPAKKAPARHRHASAAKKAAKAAVKKAAAKAKAKPAAKKKAAAKSKKTAPKKKTGKK